MPSPKVAGRLQFHISNWKLLTKDSWVQNTIQGYQLAFLGRPTQGRTPHPSQFNQELWVLIREEMDNLLEKGAISEIYNPQDGYFSNLFLVPKKDGGGGADTCHKSKGLEPFCSVRTFQNGRYTDSERPSSTRRLVDQGGSDFTIPMNHSRQEVSEIHSEGEEFQIQLPPVRTFISSMGVYQDPKASYESWEFD